MRLFKYFALLALLALPLGVNAENLKIDKTAGIILSTTSLTLATDSTDAINILVNDTAEWQIEGADADLVPVTDSDVDIGSSSKYVDNIYVDDLTVSATIGATGAVTATGGFVTGGNIVSDTDGNDSVGTAAVNFGDFYVGDGTTYTHIDEDFVDSNDATFAVVNSNGTNAGIATIGIETTADATTGAFLSVYGVGHANKGDFVLSTGDDAGSDALVTLAASDSAFDVLDDAGQRLFQISQAGVWGSDVGVTDIGLEYVTGANTACTTTCVAADGAAMFGVDLAAGASSPVIVEADDATADACLCLELAA